MSVFNFKGLIADALILGNIIYHKDMSYPQEKEIEAIAMKKGLQVFTQSQSLQNVRTVPCSQEKPSDIEIPIIEEGTAGHTNLIPDLAYIETTDITEAGVARPLVTNAKNTTSESNGTASGPETLTKDDTYVEAIDFYEDKWLGKIDGFKDKFIDGKDEGDLDELISKINSKIVETKNASKINLSDNVTSAKRELVANEKEINKFDKELAKLKSNMGTTPEEIESVEAQRISMINDGITLKNKLDAAEYKKRYQSKAEQTLNELGDIIVMVNTEIEIRKLEETKAEQKQKEETKQRVLAIIKDFESHPEQLRIFLKDNFGEIEKLDFNNKEIVGLIDTFNQALIGEEVIVDEIDDVDTVEKVEKVEKGVYITDNIDKNNTGYALDSLVKFNPINQLLQLISILQKKITIKNQPLPTPTSN